MTLPAMPALFRRLILRPMLAHRLRTAVTALGVTLGVAVVLAIQLANAGSLRGFSAALDAVSGKAALEITCPPLGLDERLIGEMSWLREFGIAAPVVEADVALANGRAEVVRLIGIDALRDPALRDYALKTDPQDDASSGMELMRFLGEPDAALITRSLAEKLGLSPEKDATRPPPSSEQPEAASPAKGDGFYPAGDRSPAASDTSPAAGDTSPAPGDTSPAKKMSSPSATAASPFAKAPSAAPDHSSPATKTLSPAEKTPSPAAGDTSPLAKKSASPAAEASPGPESAAQTVDLLVGDRKRRVKVAAILGGEKGTAASLARQSLIVMDIASAQVLLDRPGRIDRLELRLHDGLAVATAEAEVQKRLPAGLTVQRPQRRTAAVEKMLAAFHFNLTMLSGIALVVGVFLIYNTISVAVMTRRPEIGMLRTLGVTRRAVLWLFLGEALVLAAAGALLGVPLAKLLAHGAIALTSTTVDTLYVATAATVPPLTAWHWLAGFGIAVPLSLVAAALPAREAAQVTPVEAIRGSERAAENLASGRPEKAWRSVLWPLAFLALGGFAAMQPPVAGLPLWGHFASLCAIAAATCAVPGMLRFTAGTLRPWLGRWFGIEGRLAASQIAASTHRLSISVAALTVALALTVAIAVMVGSFRQTVLLWVDQTMGADLYARPGTPPRSKNAPTFSQATLDRLRAHPAVLALDGYRSLDLPLGDRLVKLGTGDFDVQLTHGRMALKTPGDVTTLLKQARDQGQIFVSESFALRFNVREGDRVTLNTPKAGPRDFTIAAQFYDYSSDSGTITMNQREFETWFGSSLPTHAAIYLKPGSDAEKVKEEMIAGMDGLGMVSLFTNAGLRAEVMRIFDSTFAITWALEVIAILVAMAGVAATMLTLVLERREELRLLRIAGAEAGQVRRTIVIESGLLGLVSQVLGLAVGVLLSLVLIHVINPQSFGWSIRFHTPWAFLIGSTVLALTATMLAGLWPAWRVTRAGGLLLLALLLGQTGSASAQQPGADWKPARPGYRYAFPRDHGPHPEHKIEWWYLTGNVRTADERRFGYQLTFFRIGATPEPATKNPWALRDVWMAHFAISDLKAARYHHADRLNRAGPGLAGATVERVWNEDWQVQISPNGRMTLKAQDRGFSLDLELEPGGAPVIHGQDGISQKGAVEGNASHYYSHVRMPTQGKLRLDGQEHAVTGLSWMDHEFGTSFLEKGTQGWDWFSAQMDDGSALMLFQLRGAAPGANAGTLIRPDGSTLPLRSGDFTLTGSQPWHSPSGAAYPQVWQIQIPGQQISLTCRAAMPAQEFTAASTPGLGYWEGAVDYTGTAAGKPLTGQGYLEMTGYSGRSMSAWFGGE